MSLGQGVACFLRPHLQPEVGGEWQGHVQDGTFSTDKLVLASRRAVDMPVKEPPVTTTVAIPGAKVEEVSSIELNMQLWQSVCFEAGNKAEKGG